MTMENGTGSRDDRPVRRHSRVRRTRIRTGTGARLLITLAIVAAVMLSIAIFFRVNEIVVRGNAVYDRESVIAATGIEKGDSLLTVNRATVAAGIELALPYAEKVRVGLVLPDTVVVEITESDVLFTVLSDSGESWLMNYRGKLVEQAEPAAAQVHPAVTGLTVRDPAAGEKAMSSSPDNLQSVLKLLESLNGTGLLDKVSAIDAAKNYDLTMWYEDQYEIRFGTTQELDYKIRYLCAVLEELMEYQTGTIDLTFEEERVARFTPW